MEQKQNRTVPRCFCSLSLHSNLVDWQPKPSQLKRYPHFDRDLSVAEIQAIVTDPVRVSQNPFYPFIRYSKSWQPFRRKDAKPHQKSRPIRYASRRDAYIFTYYRHKLSQKYEKLLKELSIEDCPIAYRKILVGDGTSRGKCNIHFANDAFELIKDLGDCIVITMDVSSYFECIDHAKLKAIWRELIGLRELPDDHYSVFCAITKYSYVDRDQLYKRLGYIKLISDNPERWQATNYRDLPRQLCSPAVFREKVRGKDSKYESIIQKNKESFRIPQGSPISDLLSNLYLIHFDKEVKGFASKLGGFYRRYCDDILVIIPGRKDESTYVSDFIGKTLKKQGRALEVKESKTSVIRFLQNKNPSFELLKGKGRNGLEYLGFRFDGRNVFLKDSTLARFYRRISYSAHSEISRLMARFPGKDISYVFARFDFGNFLKRFGRVEDFDEQGDYRNWTFWTYCYRASKVFGKKGLPILRQMRNYKASVRSRVEGELRKRLPQGLR